MSRSKLALASCGIAVALGAMSAAHAGLIQISVDGDGIAHHVRFQSVSRDGRLVAFTSHAWAGFEKQRYGEDVFVRDRQTGVVHWASISSEGAEGEGGGTDTRDSIRPAVASDGRSVVFQSNATNFYVGDSYDTMDVFVHDLDSGETLLVSRSSSGEPANARSLWPTISNDGRFISFETSATNLDSEEFGGAFVHDRLLGTTARVSIAPDGSPMAGARAVISGDGRYVAFMGSVPGAEGSSGIYVRDRGNGSTEKLVMPPIVAGAGSPAYPQISDDGAVIALLAIRWDSPRWTGEIFRYERATGEVARVGTLEHNYEEVSLSGNGRYVAYMPPADGEGARPCLLFDATTGKTTRIDSANGVPLPTDQCFLPRLAADASVISFTHFSLTGLVPCEDSRSDRKAVLYLTDAGEAPQCGAGSACGAFVCDDRDDCTLDSCVAGRCVSEPKALTETAACVLPRGWLPSACAGVGFPSTLRRQLVRVANRLSRIENASEARQRVLVRQAMRGISRVQKRVARLGSRGRVDATCTGELQAALGVAHERITELQALLRP